MLMKDIWQDKEIQPSASVEVDGKFIPGHALQRPHGKNMQAVWKDKGIAVKDDKGNVTGRKNVKHVRSEPLTMKNVKTKTKPAKTETVNDSVEKPEKKLTQLRK